MAEVIATGYLQIMPTTQGMKQALAKEMRESGSTAGAAFTDTFAKETAAASSKVSNAFDSAMAPATARLKTGFFAQMRLAIDHFGGGRAVLSDLGQQASSATQQLAGMVHGSSQLATQTGAMKAGLLGVSGLLGGPWGLAIGGGALLLNHFAEQQQAADERVKAFYDSLDKVSGKATQVTSGNIAKGLLDVVSPGDQKRLASIGVTMTAATKAVQDGGSAYTDFVARLQEVQKAEFSTTLATQGRGFAVTTTTTSINALLGAMAAQHEGLTQGTADWQKDAAAQRIAAQVTALTGDQTRATTDAVKGLSDAQIGATGRLAGYARGMAGLSTQAAQVIAKLRAVPSDVTVTAHDVGLDKLLAKVNNVRAAIAAMVGALQAGNNVAADGERHGADVSQNPATRQAGQILASYTRQYESALAALNKHNAAVTTGGKKSRGGSGGAAQSALASARQALRDQVTAAGFLSDLTAGSGKQITAVMASLTKGAQAALSGRTETATVRLLRHDTSALVALAGKRDSVAKRLEDAQRSLDSLQSAKASTVTSLTSSAMGDLVGARSSSGVLRVLNRQVATVTKFRANLTLLAKRGLPTAFLQQLVGAGLDGAMTAAALARSSDSDFTAITAVTNALSAQSLGLGQDAGVLLYDPGVQSIQGLIKGIKSQESALDKAMLNVAKSMQKAIREALGIHSPSRAFAELGKQIPAGLAVGIKAGSSAPQREVAAMLGSNRSLQLGNVSGSAGGGVDGTGAGIVVHNHIEHGDPYAVARAITDDMVWRNKR